MDKHMIQEQRIQRAAANIQEALDAMAVLVRTNPDLNTPSVRVELRSWVLAADLSLQTLKHTLHDVQPSLF